MIFVAHKLTGLKHDPTVDMTISLNTQSIAELARQILNANPLLGEKLARALFCKPSECRRGLEEVIKFMILAAENPNGPITPSARVDVAWHEFILFTRTYIGFCQDTFGKMIHHEPSDNHASNAMQYANTLAKYQQRFGQPPIEFWGSPRDSTSNHKNADHSTAFCGSCESETDS